MSKKILASLLVTCASFALTNTAQAQEAFSPIPQVTDGWRVSVSPYAWLPTVGTTDSGGGPGSKSVDLSLNNIISNLKSGAMIAGEVHYGKWGVSLDFANAVVSKSSGFKYHGDPAYQFGDKGTLQATLFNAMGTYTAFNTKDVYVDALLGVRWISLTTTLDLNLIGTPDKISSSSVASATYGVVGVNSRYRIMGSNWYVPLYADVGTAGGPNHQTWQAMTGVGVALSKLVDVSLTYRAIGFDVKSGNNNQDLIKGLFHGPQLMATFNF
jgi:hypothetical protein